MAKDKKALNVKDLSSLNTGTQISKANTKFFDNNPRLFDMASKMSRVNATPDIRNSYLLKLAGQAILNNPGSFKGTLTDNATGKTIPTKYKKGGKVKKTKSHRGDGIAKRGRTRGRIV
tara:strand:- start:233 stop:586 length:354 start_codon:yes stop_codon:yes gene_type:complete